MRVVTSKMGYTVVDEQGFVLKICSSLNEAQATLKQFRN